MRFLTSSIFLLFFRLRRLRQCRSPLLYPARQWKPLRSHKKSKIRSKRLNAERPFAASRAEARFSAPGVSIFQGNHPPPLCASARYASVKSSSIFRRRALPEPLDAIKKLRLHVFGLHLHDGQLHHQGARGGTLQPVRNGSRRERGRILRFQEGRGPRSPPGRSSSPSGASDANSGLMSKSCKASVSNFGRSRFSPSRSTFFSSLRGELSRAFSASNLLTMAVSVG